MPLDTTNGISVWIGKLPPVLIDILNKYEENVEFGTISIQEDKEIENALKFKLNNRINIPISFNVSLNDFKENSYIIKDFDEFDPSLEGVITKEVKVTPVLDKHYFNFLKQKSIQKKKNEVKSVGVDAVLNKETNSREMENLAKRRKENLREKRRERLDKPDAINLIFKAFEKNESWSIKDLSDYTGQPMAFVQEIVSEVCELNKEDHRSLYYLKNEYLKRK